MLYSDREYRDALEEFQGEGLVDSWARLTYGDLERYLPVFYIADLSQFDLYQLIIDLDLYWAI